VCFFFIDWRRTISPLKQLIFCLKLISSDTTQLIMKIVMHELDYDMDDNDLEFLEEINQYMKTECMFSF
jgi:hypothetical protein